MEKRENKDKKEEHQGKWFGIKMYHIEFGVQR